MRSDSRRTAGASAVVAVVLILASACASATGTGERAAVQVAKIASVADDANEARAIFGTRATRSEIGSAIDAARDARRFGFDTLKGASRFTAAEQLLERLDSRRDDAVVLVGHNADGIFPFADGGTIDLTALARRNAKPLIVVLSCSSLKFIDHEVAVGAPDPITYALAFRAQQYFLATLGLQELRSPARAQVVLSSALDRAARELRITTARKVALVGVPGTGLVVGYELYST
jgi:hypothetical protein